MLAKPRHLHLPPHENTTSAAADIEWKIKLLRLVDTGTEKTPPEPSAGVLQTFEDREVLINVGLIVKIVSNCTEDVITKWDCDRCTQSNQADDMFLINGSSFGSKTANLIIALRYGRLWLIVVRGTRDISNILSDVNIGQSDLPTSWSNDRSRADSNNDDNDLKCHSGFLHAWQSLGPDIILQLNKRGVLPGETSYGLLLSGHSLGAAVSTLASLDLLQASYNIIGCLNFESPLLFNRSAADFYSKSLLGQRTLRVTNQNDPVVHAPSHIFPYSHVGTELYMASGATVAICTFDQVKECRDTWNNPSDPASNTCNCSSRDRLSFLTPSQHCKTKPYLTFDFCECEDSDTKVFWITVIERTVLVFILLIILFMVYKLIRLFVRQIQKHQSTDGRNISLRKTNMADPCVFV
jgi:hypothetical protein